MVIANPNPRVRVNRVGLGDVERLVPLFDAYRQFYHLPSDPDAARTFLSDRLARGESTIFVAEVDATAVGFVQLYPTFSSLSMKPWWILNDLYVIPEARGRGVASLLLARAKELARETGADGIGLETARDNPAQKLYEAKGWKRDEVFLHYTLHV